MKLCEKCGERDATNFVVNIGEGSNSASNLCSECFLISGTPEQLRFEKDLKRARCHYCGGQPAGGGTDSLALIQGVQRMKFMCMPCKSEHSRFVQQALAKLSHDLSQQKQLEALQKLNRAADEHMEIWVASRGG